MVRIFGSPGRSRRLRAGIGLVACTALVILMAVPALAVHDLNFELDGNVAVDAGGPAFDWVSFFNSSGQPDPVLPHASRPGFDASGFDSDFNTNANGSFSTSDSTTFATGSKDTLPITPGWQCNRDNNVLSKSDVMNAYAVSYVVPSGADVGDEVMYFALERNANTGTGNVGFWFLQDGTVDCVSPGGSTAFTGAHQTGDLLIVSEFSQGGAVSTIFAYQWVGGPNGGIDPNPVAQGASCSSASGGDDICAQVNAGTLSGIPWSTANKQDGVGHSLRVSEFFEGGINLTESGLGGKCFNVFIGDTRSSTSLTATIFDFSRGRLGGCTSTTVTTPVDNSGTPIPAGGLDIPGDPADAAILVKDRAVVDVTGADTFTATLSFHLCGPFAAASTTLCTTGGVAVDSQNITVDGTYTSAAATVTSAGRYCWRADFSGDLSVGVPGSSDSSATECFTVNPRTPTLTTEAGAGPVDFGLPVTDTATLGNTAHKPGTGGPAGSNGSINPATLGGDATGTITFTLYKNNTCTVLATGTGTNPQTLPVSGNGTYGPVSFTPDAPGTYHWVASYDGDLPNTNAASASACLDENEDVVVRTIPTNIQTKQSWYPNDTATISASVGNLGAGGSVVFSLYGTSDCSSAVLYTETKSITGGATSQEVGTNNTTFNITTGYADASGSFKSYSWKVVYTPAAGDTAHTGKQSTCDAEHFAITYTNDNGPGSNLP